MIQITGLDYAKPVNVANEHDGCFFYHSMDIPNIPGLGVRNVPGTWDLRGRFADYTGGVDFAGKSVLDVGVATGWISFEAERHGAAEVVGVDLPHGDRPQHIPCADDPEGARVAGSLASLARLRRSYWLCHSLYGSHAKVAYCNIYDIGQHISGADIVVVGQILTHLRDPLHALWQCAQAANDTLIIVEGSFESETPLMVFHGSREVFYSWFHLSTGCYKKYLDILGFDVTSITKNSYNCAHYKDPTVDVWTIVAKRIGPTARIV
jgi:2-polyprenyl-3-methyl-5-hydroxy-6-metoxy-1,4-benzoquinol methylase